ncbi:alpha/beta hydrolase family esterase [Marinibactrum halimedae]|uniref:PHB depolymerase family esterase n=1 Tax=Marinibactrum halimedae TaxID=1444977 RepID=A0AA37TB57_9GAMM|nr:PHB depolymerase family esterase [Marinibactrum halimedae]MCD9460030.1 PHB depolymerase family esterase [Marinibactrum halimedae]GLS28202.1 hypothetical protein GCM10007877_39210 [Marinibactrum halimedae]
MGSHSHSPQHQLIHFPFSSKKKASASQPRQLVPGKNIDHCFNKKDYKSSRQRQYRVHLPSNYSSNKTYPLVAVLHGCGQTHEDIQAITNMDNIADRDEFIVVYPFVTSYNGMRGRNCWAWWLPNHIHSGAGEVEDIWQILQEVQQEYSVDERRIHVAGLSSGAGMAVALMVTQAQHIASGAAVAGVPYSESAHAVNLMRHLSPSFKPVDNIVESMDNEMGERKRAVPLFIAHSHNDTTVDIQAAINLRDSWAECFDVPVYRKSRTENGETGDTQWELTAHSSHHQRNMIQTLFLHGPDHGWYGGLPGRFSYPEGPNISEHIWEFFQENPLTTNTRLRDKISAPLRLFKR